MVVVWCDCVVISLMEWLCFQACRKISDSAVAMVVIKQQAATMMPGLKKKQELVFTLPNGISRNPKKGKSEGISCWKVGTRWCDGIKLDNCGLIGEWIFHVVLSVWNALWLLHDLCFVTGDRSLLVHRCGYIHTCIIFQRMDILLRIAWSFGFLLLCFTWVKRWMKGKWGNWEKRTNNRVNTRCALCAAYFRTLN